MSLLHMLAIGGAAVLLLIVAVCYEEWRRPSLGPVLIVYGVLSCNRCGASAQDWCEPSCPELVQYWYGIRRD